MKNFDLLSELKKYTPFDNIEKKYVIDTIEFLENGNNQFVRTNFKKHITASAFLLNDSLDAVLSTRHKALKMWLPFGGHSDGEKNSLNVALRETIEESGIDKINVCDGKIFDIDIHKIPENKNKNEPSHFHIDIRFVFTTNETCFTISDESENVAWFTLNEFINMLLDDSYSGGKRIAEKLTRFIKK